MHTSYSRNLIIRRVLFACLALAMLSACGSSENTGGPRRITYWEKWSGFESEAAEQVVARFNDIERLKAQSEPGYRPIEVKYVSVARIEQKLLVAIAGGNPPDVAGAYTLMLYPYVDKGAVLDLTPMLEKAGISRDQFIPSLWDLGRYHDRQWALPTTPATTALHWNRRLFSEAGFDPDIAPRTIEELDHYAEQMTKWEVVGPDGVLEIRSGYCPEIPNENKRLIQVGFLPSEPNWWNYAWGNYFGGDLMSDTGEVTTVSPENIRAYDWVASFSRKLGVQNVQRFVSGFGNFSSPQNAFMSGKIAMEIQGVWMYNFIENYAPGMKWGVAPFPYPEQSPQLKATTFVDADLIMIPKGSPHPEEAFEFIKYLMSQEGMEQLCLGHRKFSSLLAVSEHFYRDHPHPYIRIFRDLALSSNRVSSSKTGIWAEYRREMSNAVGRIQNLNVSPRVGLSEVQSRIANAEKRNQMMLTRRGLSK